MLPKEHKMKAIMYVQSLQDNWSDDTERTKIIINFESFLVES
jgi:hypothetical protein